MRRYLSHLTGKITRIRQRPVVNVLTRTHDREALFRRCRESVRGQSYRNINHIIGSASPCPYHPDAIRLTPKSVTGEPPNPKCYPAPYNLHLNELATHVKDGWVMYLDDDDMFTTRSAVKQIADHITHEDQLLLWRVNINERIVPDDEHFGHIVDTHISGIGFMFHSRHLPVDWGCWSHGDFRVISTLAERLETVWIDAVLTATQGPPHRGGRRRKPHRNSS